MVRLLDKMVDLPESSAEIVLHPEMSLISSIKVVLPKLDVNVLREKYEVLGLSAQQIADEFASSRTTVLSALKRAGINVRSKSDPHGRPSNPPYGKHLVNGKLVDCPDEIKVIELIQRLSFNDELSYRAIAKTLTELGIKTRKDGSPWHHERVRSIVNRILKSKIEK